MENFIEEKTANDYGVKWCFVEYFEYEYISNKSKFFSTKFDIEVFDNVSYSFNHYNMKLLNRFYKKIKELD